MRALRAFALCTVGLMACGDDNSLSGSVADFVSLQFDSMVITQNSDTLNIIYKRNDGSRVTNMGVNTGAVNLQPGTVLDGNTFLQAVTLTRSTPDPNDVWPSVINGQVTFKDVNLGQGGHVSGAFSAIFGRGGKFSVGGYELLGNFSGNVQVTQ